MKLQRIWAFWAFCAARVLSGAAPRARRAPLAPAPRASDGVADTAHLLFSSPVGPRTEKAYEILGRPCPPAPTAIAGSLAQPELAPTVRMVNSRFTPRRWDNPTCRAAGRTAYVS